MKKASVIALINEVGILPSARVNTKEFAIFAAETLYETGLPILEVTLTVPRALEAINELAERFPDMAVGAGTVLNADLARQAIDAGARFLTSPGFVPGVVECAKRSEVVVFPGAMTPSEVIAAWTAGSDFVKIFPTAPVGGVQYIKSLKVPLPQIPLIVSGGVSQATATDYILAGAAAIGVGGELLPMEALVMKQANRIRELARRFIAMVKDGRALRETFY